MSEQTYRTIGSLLGLAIGIGMMYLLGLRGIVPSAMFGAGGCVAGVITAEKLHAASKNRDQ